MLYLHICNNTTKKLIKPDFFAYKNMKNNHVDNLYLIFIIFHHI